MAAGGETLGTVGGGSLEAQAIDIAWQVLNEGRPRLRRFSLAGSSATEGGMICGGEAELLVEPLNPANPHFRRILPALLAEMAAGRPAWLVRSLKGEPGPGEGTEAAVGLGLLTDAGFDAGSLDLTGADREALQAAAHPVETRLLAGGTLRYLLQPTGHIETVYLFGAGHIARELAPITAALGFRVVVIDDRPDFVTAERFPAASQRLVVPSYEGCFAGLAIDGASYLVIVTHGHAHDREVLAAALTTGARYIGMIASRRKREILFGSLRDDGVAAEALVRVHSPIGLAIGAQTPVEIAVSIAAELVAVRRDAVGEGRPCPLSQTDRRAS
jgi:xanthine dehydrogenase accessory factor